MSASVDADSYDPDKHGRLVQELRAILGDNVRSEHDDRALYKWLKARKFDVKAAGQMYRDSMEWRRRTGADTILKDFTVPEVITKYYPGNLFGTARDGCPVWIEPMGQGDLRGILSCISKDDIIKSMIYRLEALYARFRELSAQQQKPVDKCIHIIDVDGFGIRHLHKPVLDMYIEVLGMLESNYPETLKVSYIVRAPRVFKVGFDFLKKFIDPVTADKLIVLDHSSWQSTLLDVIDADQLPKAYGGNKVDENGDPTCRQWICYGGPVPRRYYAASGAPSLLPSDKPIEHRTLGRRATLSVDFDITTADQTALRWAFCTTSGDVAFGVRRRAASGRRKQRNDSPGGGSGDDVERVLQPMTKYDCSTTPVEAMLICDVVGKYTLEFFNPSLLFTRSLSYYVELVQIDNDSRTVVEQTANPTAEHIVCPTDDESADSPAT